MYAERGQQHFLGQDTLIKHGCTQNYYAFVTFLLNLSQRLHKKNTTHTSLNLQFFLQFKKFTYLYLTELTQNMYK